MFEMKLLSTGVAGLSSLPVANPDIDDEFDDDEGIETTVCLICEYIHASKRWRFSISGFGDDSWPVDIRTDFDIVLEQLPDLMAWVSDPQETAVCLDLYEQGLERRMTFSHLQAGIARIECSNGPDWLPVPRTEDIRVTSLLHLLSDLIENTKIATLDCAPKSLVERPAFNQWLASVSPRLQSQ